MTITRMLEVLTTSKTKWEDLPSDEQKAFNVYIVNSMLSTHPDCIELINYTQYHYNLPKDMVYNIYLRMLPSKKIHINYMKKSKKEKYNKDLLVIMSEYYEISIKDVVVYLNVLKEKDVEDILIRLGKDKKEITKLFKP
jgi:hypothetical protein